MKKEEHTKEEDNEEFEGGWHPIKDIKDPCLVVIAKFAISEYNKHNNLSLKFQTIVAGDEQFVGGINYRLVLNVIDGCKESSMMYEAEEQMKKEEHTMEEDNEEFEGGWHSIKDIKDPCLVVIAEFAISEYNKHKNLRLKLQKIVSGDEQFVGGINYRLVLNVTDGCKEGSMIYEAEVFEQAWLDFMELNYFKPIN
ncbi:hypothetical protein Bca101_027451 [Brassica carinata]